MQPHVLARIGQRKTVDGDTRHLDSDHAGHGRFGGAEECSRGDGISRLSAKQHQSLVDDDVLVVHPERHPNGVTVRRLINGCLDRPTRAAEARRCAAIGITPEGAINVPRGGSSGLHRLSWRGGRWFTAGTESDERQMVME